jgi:starch synthase
MATSEAAPFAKTGGLADVCGALPIEIARLGHHVALFLPAYRQALNCGCEVRPLGIGISANIGRKRVTGRLLKSHLPGSSVPVYLVEQDDYFHRDALYGVNGADYIDNCERFVFFCRAVMEAIRLLGLEPDILHAHDWQTGLLPAYLATEYRGVPGYENTASVFTIHNLGYQGKFWHWDMELTGLDWKYFNWQQMEYYGHLNLLKTGLVFADALTTVSPRYAEEIQQEGLGCGLEGVLHHRREVLTGILNGVDYRDWNPATDPHLVARYSASDMSGKAACKSALQNEIGLAELPQVPVVGMVGRLSDQKGFDLASGIIQQWVESSDVQWAILGTGEPKYHEMLWELAHLHPEKVGVRLEFSEPLAHRIIAGADMFLMPSKYEPCGLTQLYSLHYGTVPVVRATGGLVDTVVDADESNLAAGRATGFGFTEYSTKALGRTLERACQLFRNERLWRQLQLTGMAQDFSWGRSARQYLALYEATLRRVRREVSCA